MLNYFWLALIALAFIIGAVTGHMSEVTKAAVESAGTAVKLAIGLIGVMALWLGIMKIAEEAGLIRLLARIIKPITRWLFPDLPPEHPAVGSMLMNIAANWLGLGNAATPLGLKAMQDLQQANSKKDTASDAMVVFMALNTATICLIPATMIGIRVAAGSGNPTEIIAPTILASTCATIVGVTAAKLLSKLPIFRKDLTEESSKAADIPDEKET
ncbi:MAG: nucleoside recognition protein [candidate division KSB1 bacterium]|nr:nucleoside recognition protein [candidate division KSB1 bacterium]